MKKLLYPLSISCAAAVCVVSQNAAAQPVTPAFQGLGSLPGGNYVSEAWDVSGDGSTVVGLSNSFMGIAAFRWTQADGMIGLGDLPGGSYSSRSNAVSADGSAVVGRSVSASGPEAYRWTQADGMIGLGDLPGGVFFSGAYGISFDVRVFENGGSPGSAVWQFDFSLSSTDR